MNNSELNQQLKAGRGPALPTEYQAALLGRDVAEPTAASSGLQDAADELAGRIFARLVP